MTARQILHSVRVLDFTWVLAGPYGTRLLADFGVELIKVHPLFPTEDEDAFSRGYYRAWNRNKRSITLNLNTPEGIALAKRLVGMCDAVIENFTPRVMANWGLDYRNLKKTKPDIIMVSMSAMGPKSHYTGFGPTVHALSGLTGLMKIGPRPVGPGFSYADHVAGLYASLGLLEALEHRRRTGKGKHLEISEVALMQNLLPSNDSSTLLQGVFQCRGENAWAAFTIENEDQWRKFIRALGSPEWAKSPRYATHEKRFHYREELNNRISRITRRKSLKNITSLLKDCGIAVGAVQDAAALVKEPQLKARRFFRGGEDNCFLDAAPVKISGNKIVYRAAPLPGQDNHYVYHDLLGMSREEIFDYNKRGII